MRSALFLLEAEVQRATGDGTESAGHSAPAPSEAQWDAVASRPSHVCRMAKIPKTHICQHCKEAFIPDWRNRHRQRFCQKPECRNASKNESQQAWLATDPNYFHGYEHAERIQGWREANPDYRRRSRAQRQPTLAAGGVPGPAPSASRHADEKRREASAVPVEARALLQDFIRHNPLMLGLISHLFGCVLQDDFQAAITRLLSMGAEAQCRMRRAGASPRSR